MKQPQFYRTFNYNKALLPNAHLAALEEGVQTIDAAMKKTGLTIGYPGWGLIYYILLSHLEPRHHNNIVETGTNWGCSTIMLAQALKDSGCSGSLFTIELDPENYQIAAANFSKAGVADRVNAINDDSRNVLPKLVNELDEIRIAFLDASHNFKDILFEFYTIYPKLSDHSLVVFDNTYQIAEPHEDQRVNGALRYIHRRYGGQLINLEFVSWYTPGLAIWQKKPFDD